ncbi:hypothetical protein [Oceanithermus desulfurans]|uniref:Uncharacterized protein n=2 Tax=Oceanithermus desulfurans TaxID=227924 RepID=A0A511RNZ7_9DEIN|nr:hypothetical protein [Oceanithermus desulfurans]MBB6030806.1 hypothetical protein [Oceanithermus desulfurans]GEM90652.1 hypothetical protein ODE01S_20860 [Oceanithermus desulfurans NBRC 100063]
MKQLKYVFLGAFIVLLGLWAVALTVPHTFREGDVISSAKINEDFQTLADAVTVLEAKLSAVQAAQKALPSNAGVLAYAYVDNNAPANNLYYAFNSTGGNVSVTYEATGTYRVTFENLDLSQVSLMLAVVDSTKPQICTNSPIASSTDTVTINCFNYDGTATDTAFYITIVR